jgi:putative oxidoreductase
MLPALVRPESRVVWQVDAIGVGQWFRYITGGIEVSIALLLLLPSRAVFGSILLAGTMAGAILTHLVILHTSPAGPVVLLVMVAVITWLRQIRSAPRPAGYSRECSS